MRITISAILLAIGLSASLATGCGNSREKARNAAWAKIPVSLENAETYKTPKGKPVRVIKVIMGDGNIKREHLLMAVGDVNVPVTMPDAATIDIGGKQSKHPFMSQSMNTVTALSVADPAKFIVVNTLGGGGGPPMARPAPGGMAPPAAAGFPMAALKAKISGETLNLPELDTL